MPKSREELTNISNTNRELCRVLDLIWSDIKVPKATTGLFHVVNLDNLRLFPNGRGIEIKDALLSLLKTEYPGCDVRYNETIGFSGSVIERVIIIDWSSVFTVHT
jgi:hypothetical protein